jgi:hypothetical protein
VTVRLTEILGRPPDTVTPPLNQLVTELISRTNQASVLVWIGRRHVGTALAALAAYPSPFSHQVIDEIVPRPARAHLRQLLIHTNVLPERDEFLERLPDWLDQTLLAAPAEHARLVRPFASWVVLRKARRNARRRVFTEASGSWARRQIKAALALFRWLDEHDLRLAETSQGHLDQWLASGATTRYEARAFIDWASQRGLSQDLSIPARPRQAALVTLNAEQRCATLRRLWHDTTVDLDTRVAGSILLLFGYPVSRIKMMTCEHITIIDGTVYLRLATTPLRVPDPLADLLTRLRQQRQDVRPGRRWLFPANPPTRPINSETLRLKLSEHGIQARPARNAALAEFAADLPAPVLADALGLSIGTATHWVGALQRDWMPYLAARATKGNTAREE